MSAPREGTCQIPGPYDAHCTDYPGHRYSCYDAGDDVSFNERQMREDGIAHGHCAHCDGDPGGIVGNFEYDSDVDVWRPVRTGEA